MRAWFALLLVFWIGAPGALAAQGLIVYEARPLPQGLHPFTLGATPQGLRLSALITERLARVDVGANRLELTLFEAPPEGPSRRVILSLKAGIRFSDGRPLVPQDIEESFRRLSAWASGAAGQDIAPKAARRGAEVLRRSLFLLADVEALGEGRVAFTFRAPVRGEELPALLAPLPILPHGVGDDVLAAPGAPTLGPYVVTTVGPEAIALEANPHYALGAPLIPEVEVIAADPQALAEALATPGAGELALYIPENVGDLSASWVLRAVASRRFTWLGFNMAPGARLAGEPELTRALTLLIDLRGLMDVLPPAPGGRQPLGGPYAPGAALSTGSTPVPMDRAAGEALLEEAGLTRVGESWRDDEGGALSLTLWIAEDLPGGAEAGAQIVDQLHRVNIPVRTEVAPRATLEALIEVPSAGFDLLLMGWLLDESEDLHELLHSRGLYNLLRYKNKDLDALLDRERRAQLADSRRLYRQLIEGIVAEQPPGIFLWQEPQVVAFRGDVTGVPPLDPYFIYRDVHLWEIGAEGASPKASQDGGGAR